MNSHFGIMSRYISDNLLGRIILIGDVDCKTAVIATEMHPSPTVTMLREIVRQFFTGRQCITARRADELVGSRFSLGAFAGRLRFLGRRFS
ncbi:hypothetical protein BFS79_11510 [Cutibacterium avidum]|nr:hypothetical protein BFS79_11510 [Cutibacterium avidum]